MEKANLKAKRPFITVCIFIIIAALCRNIGREIPGRFLSLLRSLIYAGLFSYWFISVRRRVMQAAARRSGADSLWYKDHGGEELLGVMQKTFAGGHIFPDKSPSVEIGDALSDELSEMQKNILRLYIKGNSYAAIGKTLYIEETTVKYHMNQMIKKCGFKSKQQLIAAAIDSTIITTID